MRRAFCGSARVFVHHRHDPDDPGTLSHDSIEDLFIDSSEGGETLSPRGDQGGETLSPRGDQGGETLWVASHGGLDHIDPQTGLISRYDSVSLCSGKVLTVTASSSGTLWVGTEAGLDELDPATGEVRHHRHQPGAREEMRAREDRVIALYDDGAGSVWVGTEGAGLGRYVPTSGAHAGFRHRYYDPFSLASDRIEHLFADRSGLLWIATSIGLHKLAPQAMAFGLHRPDPLDPESLSSAKVTTLHQSRDGVVWVGTPRGLDALDRRAGRMVWRVSTWPLRACALTRRVMDCKASVSTSTARFEAWAVSSFLVARTASTCFSPAGSSAMHTVRRWL